MFNYVALYYYYYIYVQICCRLRIIRFKLCQFTGIHVQVHRVTAFICWVLRLQKSVPNKKQTVFRQLQRFSKSAINFTSDFTRDLLAKPIILAYTPLLVHQSYIPNLSFSHRITFISGVLLSLGHLVHILCTKTRINTLNYSLFWNCLEMI